MKHLTSRDNPLFKRLKALSAGPQHQRRAGVMLLEGAHLAQACLAAGVEPEHCVVSDTGLDHAEIAALVARIDPAHIVVLPHALFEQISTLVNGVGILLVAPLPQHTLPPRLVGDCVVLDGVQDAGNVGSILRSAAAANIRAVYCISGTAFAWAPKVVRAGMGAHFLLDIVEGLDPQTLIERLDVPIAITDSHGAAAVFDSDLRAPLAWVFGNEGAGVSAPWRAAATQRVTIPQPGGVESLNVAAAAAVCLFEQVRQRR